ncbi:MAG: hypothetical protein ACQKBT_00055 [Puniceicoccales bacterium]
MTTKTESKTEVCEACAYWNAKSESEGECRRQPPQEISFTVADDVKFETRFPKTDAKDWCGEFTKK